MIESKALGESEDITFFNDGEPCWCSEDIGYEEHCRTGKRKALRCWSRVYRQQRRACARTLWPRTSTVRPGRTSSAQARHGRSDGAKSKAWRQQVHGHRWHKKSGNRYVAALRGIGADGHCGLKAATRVHRRLAQASSQVEMAPPYFVIQAHDRKVKIID